MSDCPQCGAELGSGDPAGLCPQCLILGAFDSLAGPEESGTQTLEIPTAPGDDDFGRYRILGALGEGGMGTVYLAEQSEPIRRRVALKVVKLGIDGLAHRPSPRTEVPTFAQKPYALEKSQTVAQSLVGGSWAGMPTAGSGVILRLEDRYERASKHRAHSEFVHGFQHWRHPDDPGQRQLQCRVDQSRP